MNADEAVREIEQTLRELEHAYFNPSWFTDGKQGATRQFLLWHRRGTEAIAMLKEEISNKEKQ